MCACNTVLCLLTDYEEKRALQRRAAAGEIVTSISTNHWSFDAAPGCESISWMPGPLMDVAARRQAKAARNETSRPAKA